MTNHKEILRLHSLGISNAQIASACTCSRTTVINALKQAKERGITSESAGEMTGKELSRSMFPAGDGSVGYKMPDYE